MKRRLLPIFLAVCLAGCFGHEEQELSGPTYVDSTGVILNSRESMQNIERAQIHIVVERVHPELARAPIDTCGSPALGFTADVVMIDGRDFVFSGHGDSPCNPGAPSTTINLASPRDSSGLETLPQGRISTIRLRSTKPVTLQKIEWQTWEQGV